MGSRNRLAGTKRSSSIEEEEDVDNANATGESSEYDSSSHYTGSYDSPDAETDPDLAPKGLSINHGKGKGKAKVTEPRKKLKKMQSAGALVEGRSFGGFMRSRQVD
jgi:hypothetical protein